MDQSPFDTGQNAGLGWSKDHPAVIDAGHSAPRLTCRRMIDDDIEAALALLGQGFPERPLAYWSIALERLRTRRVPEGRPRYGYVLGDHNRLVGIILVIFAETDEGRVRGNVSSWHVQPAYRAFSHILLSQPLKAKDVCLFNISPAPATIGTIEAQGFRRYVGGTFFAMAASTRRMLGVMVRRVGPEDIADTILVDHARWGCVACEVVQAGESHPFVFARQRVIGGRVQAARLVYCRSLTDFTRFAGPLGRHLLRAGCPLILVDSDRPLEGLRGIFRPGRTPRYCRGPEVPRLGDLSYSELAIFGA